MFRNQFDQAIAYGKRAVELNPNGADWHAQLARTLSLVGKAEEALVEIKKAIRLNPTLQKGPQFTLGRIYYQTAQYEKAVSLFRPLAEQYPGFHTPNFFLVASLAASGRLKEARAAAEKVKGLPLGRVPKSWVRRWSFAFKNKRDNDRLLKDLAKAGLEE